MRLSGLKAALAATTLLAQRAQAGPLDTTLLKREDAPINLRNMTWQMVGTMPELSPAYSFNRWADLMPNETASSHWNSATGLVFRGNFRSPGEELTLALTVQGGPGFACQVWMGDHHIGSFVAKDDTEASTDLSFTIKKTDTDQYVDYDLVVYIDSIKSADPANDAKAKRGITQSSLTYTKNSIGRRSEEVEEMIAEPYGAPASLPPQMNPVAADIGSAVSGDSSVVGSAESGGGSAGSGGGSVGSPVSEGGSVGSAGGNTISQPPSATTVEIQLDWKFAGYLDNGVLRSGGLFYERKSCDDSESGASRNCDTYLKDINPFNTPQTPGVHYYETELFTWPKNDTTNELVRLDLKIFVGSKSQFNIDINFPRIQVPVADMIPEFEMGDIGIEGRAVQPRFEKRETDKLGRGLHSRAPAAKSVLKVYLNDEVVARIVVDDVVAGAQTVSSMDLTPLDGQNRIAFVLWSGWQCPPFYISFAPPPPS